MSRAFRRRQNWLPAHPTAIVCALFTVMLLLLSGVNAAHADAVSAASPLTAPARYSADLSNPQLHSTDGAVDTEAELPTTTLEVTSDAPVLRTDEPEYRFTATITNPTAAPLQKTMLTLSISTAAVSSATAIDTPPVARTLRALSRTSVSALPAGESREITFTVPREQFPLSADTPAGVYTLTAELTLPQSEPFDVYADPIATAAPAPLTWQGLPEDRTAAVTFVVPLVLPADITVMPNRSQLAAEAPRLQAIIDAAQNAQATLAVDPRIIAAIRTYGEAAPAAAQNLLDSLMSTQQPVFLLQYSDADPATQAALGATELLRPLGFSFLTRNGVFTDPSATDALRNPESLTELGALPQSYPGAWPATGNLDRATLQLLHNASLTSLIVDSRSVPAATTPKVEFEGFTAVVTDHELTQLSTAWLRATRAPERSALTARLVAELTLHGLDQGSGVVIAVDRATASDSTVIPEYLSTLLTQPGVVPQSEFNLPVSTTEYSAAAPLESHVEALRAVRTSSEQIRELAPLLVTPHYLDEYQQLRMLHAFATRYAESGTDIARLSAQYSARDAELLRGVAVVSTATTHLTGVSSRVPVTLHNHLPFDSQVTVHVSPGSAAIEIPQQQSDLIAVPARGNTVHQVTVDSRVSSGESQLLIEVRDREANTTFGQMDMRLTLRTSYETLLLTGVGASAVLLFVAGIWRSVRRRNSRAKRPNAQPPHSRSTDAAASHPTGMIEP